MIGFIEIVVPWFLILVGLFFIVATFVCKSEDYLFTRLMIIAAPVTVILAFGLIVIGLTQLQCGGWISSGCH